MNRRTVSKLMALAMVSTVVALTSCSHALLNAPYEPIEASLETAGQLKSPADVGVTPAASPLAASTAYDVVLESLSVPFTWYLNNAGVKFGHTIYDGIWEVEHRTFEAMGIHDPDQDALVLSGYYSDGDVICMYLHRTADPSVFAGIGEWVRDTAMYTTSWQVEITQGSIP